MSHILRALEAAKGKLPPPETPSGKAPPAPTTDAEGKHSLPPLPPLPDESPAPPERPVGLAPAAMQPLQPYAGPTTRVAPGPSRKLIIGAALLVSILAASAAWWWYQQHKQPPPAEPVADVPPAASAPAPTPSAPSTTGEPSAELTEKVRNLAVSATAGDGKRVLISGKVYTIGDAVSEGLLVHEIYPDVVVFRDKDGNFYSRRF